MTRGIGKVVLVILAIIVKYFILSVTSILNNLPIETRDEEARIDQLLGTERTFRSLIDAVIPKTPQLSGEYGDEHVPGGLQASQPLNSPSDGLIATDGFMRHYTDGLLEEPFLFIKISSCVIYFDRESCRPRFGPPDQDSLRTFQLSTIIAKVLNTAALKYLKAKFVSQGFLRGLCQSVMLILQMTVERPFTALSAQERLQTIGYIDKVNLRWSPVDSALFESDFGSIGQLAVGFTEMIYYSEWQGYEGGFLEFDSDMGSLVMLPPDELEHSNSPTNVQSWRQTGYPGFQNGYAVLRGYVGTDDSPLGEGEVWRIIDENAPAPVSIMRQPGSFQENEYDVDGYEEPYPEGAL